MFPISQHLPSCFSSQHKFPCSLHTEALPGVSGTQTWGASSRGGGRIETDGTAAPAPSPRAGGTRGLKGSRRQGSEESEMRTSKKQFHTNPLSQLHIKAEGGSNKSLRARLFLMGWALRNNEGKNRSCQREKLKTPKRLILTLKHWICFLFLYILCF